MDPGMTQEFSDVLDDFVEWLAELDVIDLDRGQHLVQQFLAQKNAEKERSDVR